MIAESTTLIVGYDKHWKFTSRRNRLRRVLKRSYRILRRERSKPGKHFDVDQISRMRAQIKFPKLKFQNHFMVQKFDKAIAEINGDRATLVNFFIFCLYRASNSYTQQKYKTVLSVYVLVGLISNIFQMHKDIRCFDSNFLIRY